MCEEIQWHWGSAKGQCSVFSGQGSNSISIAEIPHYLDVGTLVGTFTWAALISSLTIIYISSFLLFFPFFFRKKNIIYQFIIYFNISLIESNET